MSLAPSLGCVLTCEVERILPEPQVLWWGGGLPEHRYVGHPSAGPEWRWCGKPEPIAGGKELGLPLRRLLSWRFGWGQACFADWGIGGVG